MASLSSRHLSVAAAQAHNSRLGIWLFLIYLALYAGFVLVNAFRPMWMELRPWGGINVALIYGFGLIFAALILSLVYGWLARIGTNDGAVKDSR